MKTKLFSIITAFALILPLTGCSVFMAAKQPGKLDTSLFKVGTPRGLLLAEFGLPIASETRKGEKTEIFKFKQGYSGGAKAGRAVFHGVADVLTLGLWEIVGTPAEGAFDGDEMAYQVSYDDDDKILEVIILKRNWPR